MIKVPYVANPLSFTHFIPTTKPVFIEAEILQILSKAAQRFWDISCRHIGTGK
jgi:hypothetical protein